MITAWKGHADGDIQVASDQFTVQTHGMGITHIDALCHFGFQEKGFNGKPFREIASMDGVSLCGTDELGVIVTRGILADIPRSRGVDYLKPGVPVTASDLEVHLEDAQSGDALVVRTGRWAVPKSKMEMSDHPPLSGLHADCMQVIQDADIALLGTDAGGDNFPPVLDENSRPVHVFSLVYLGLPLLHNLDLEALAAACDARGASSFFFAVAPLNMPGTTGSPVTPIAII
jgi:kynurenine formamidase